MNPNLAHLVALCGAAFWLSPSLPARADQPWKINPAARDRVELVRGKDLFEITVHRDNIVEFNFRPGGKTGSPSPVFAGFDGQTLPQEAPAVTTSGSAVITTPALTVTVDPAWLEIHILDSTGKLLCRLTDWTSDGCAVKRDHQSFFNLGPDGNVGAGYQGNNGGPFIWSTDGYGLFWDSDGGNVHCDDHQALIRRTSGDNYPRPDFDCFVITGAPREILSGFADVSGHAPMFPKWSLGFMVSRYGFDEKEQLQNVDLFRQKKIPFDTYIVDYDWFNYGGGELCDFQWNTDKFPDGPSGKLCKELLAPKGVKMVGIRKPRISSPINGKSVQELEAKGWILPHQNAQPLDSREFNFHIPAARAWWWSQEQPLFESGFAGYWNDEADIATHFHFMEMVMTEYQGQRSVSNQRVWTLNRNFYTGSQRYAYALWSGDIQSDFPTMAAQRPRMMKAICGGESWWSMDTGGFNGGTPTPENYTRWMQFAAFVPIMRGHGHQFQKREPWNYGPQAEAVVKRYIELRYRLMPYLYSGAWQISAHGLPLARPMWLDYSADPQVSSTMTDQWMVGDYLLVRPVVDQGATSAKVYLPAGTWVDYWTGQLESGNQWITRPVDAKTWEDIPLYVKRGAIIPTAPPMLYVGQVPIDPLTIEIYPGSQESSFAYYDDDGKTYDYEKGVRAEIPMTCSPAANGIAFEIAAQQGTYILPTKTCVLRFHLLDDKRTPAAASLDGRALPRLDSTAALDAASEGWTATNDASGPIIEVRSKFAAPERFHVSLN